MLDLEPILEFSRHNCVAICSFLVPVNLIATIISFVLVIMERSREQLSWWIACASVLAIALFAHVSTWLMVGVVTPVTFILSGLGATCLTINALALIYRRQILQFVSANRSITK